MLMQVRRRARVSGCWLMRGALTRRGPGPRRSQTSCASRAAATTSSRRSCSQRPSSSPPRQTGSGVSAADPRLVWPRGLSPILQKLSRRLAPRKTKSGGACGKQACQPFRRTPTCKCLCRAVGRRGARLWQKRGRRGRPASMASRRPTDIFSARATQPRVNRTSAKTHCYLFMPHPPAPMQANPGHHPSG